MKRVLILGLSLLVFTACHSQQKGQVPQKKRGQKSKTVKTPHGSWTVHKKYDKNGNLIQMDSTYSYSYSSINGKKVPQAKMDSLFGFFQNDIHSNFGQMNIPRGFNRDSLANSFFHHNFGNLQKMHQRMMQQMRAMQQHFLQHFGHRDWIPREEKPHQPSKEKNSKAIPPKGAQQI